MSAITYKQEELQKRTVRFTGDDALKKGYPVCWNRDSTTALDLAGTSGAATVRNWNRYAQVEKPAAGNIRNFAGYVGRDYPAATGGRDIELIIPRNGCMVDGWAKVNCTLGSTPLCVQAGSYELGVGGFGPVVGIAYQTVDRSSTAGLVQMECRSLDPVARPYESATGRLGSPLIWETCPWADLVNGLVDGHAYFNDFTIGRYTQAANVAAAASTIYDGGSCAFTGATAGATVTANTAAPYGVVELRNTTDGETTILQCLGSQNVAGQVVFESGKKLWMEARIKVSNITVNEHGVFCGFAEEARAVAAGIITAADALADIDAIGFFKNAAGTSGVGTVYHTAAGAAATVLAAAAATLVADTWIKLGIYCDGTTIYFFVDGVVSASSVALATAEVPDGEEMAFYLAVVTGSGGGDELVSIDWVRIAQLR